MLIGTVINTLQTKRCNPHLAGQKLLLIKSMEALTPALDQVGAQVGDRVLRGTKVGDDYVTQAFALYKVELPSES